MTVTIEQEDWRKVLAEVVGTFFFFFIGIGSATVAGPFGVLYVALAHGVALSIAISALGHISGAHFNPAVTIGMLVTRKISPILALLYIVGQIVGGILACLALVIVLPEQLWRAASLGTPGIAARIGDSPGVGTGQAIVLEALLTFFLVLAIFGTVVDTRPNRIAGFGIGLTVFVDILVGGPITGGVMNPARALSPAIVSGTWSGDQLVYWAGPTIGAIVAALLYTAFFLPRGDEPEVRAPELPDRTVEPPLSEPGLLKD